MAASILPPRHRLAQWSLQYSSSRHGISLQTLYRRAQPGPCLLLIRDTAGYVFGCFTPLSWRPSPRYYGTGETIVFQLQVCLLASAARVCHKACTCHWHACQACADDRALVTATCSVVGMEAKQRATQRFLHVCCAALFGCWRWRALRHIFGRRSAARRQRHQRDVWQPMPS